MWLARATMVAVGLLVAVVTVEVSLRILGVGYGGVHMATSNCTAPGSLDTYLCYAAWRSSYSSRASIGV